MKIILSLHILLWRPEIRPRIALRLRANLVLLGRRRWKRFLEYWEGKTLENYFCARWVPWFVKNSPSQGLWSSWLCPNAFYAWNVFSSSTNYSKRESERKSMNKKWWTFFCTVIGYLMQEIDLPYDIHIHTSVPSSVLDYYLTLALCVSLKYLTFLWWGRGPMSPISDDGNIRNWGSFFSLSIYHNFLPKPHESPVSYCLQWWFFFTQLYLPAVTNPQNKIPKWEFKRFSKLCHMMNSISLGETPLLMKTW